MAVKERDAERNALIDARTERRVGRQPGSVSVIPVRGMILPRANIFEMFGLATSVQRIEQYVRAAVEDSETKAIILDMHSPGGVVSGVTELAAKLRDMRGTKPIIAHANYLMASAAYWIASSADQIEASPSAIVGSVGIYGMHLDQSGALEQMGLKVTLIADPAEKVDGNSFEPLSETARAEIQRLVSHDLQLFRADVAAGRGIKKSAVVDEWARAYVATDALANGLIDKIRPLSETLSAYGVTSVPAPADRGRALAATANRDRQALLRNLDMALRDIG